MAADKKTQVDDPHRHRVSGISGRTAGKMHRQFRAKPSSERRGLRQKVALRPMGKGRFANGCKYSTMAGEPIPGC